MQTVRVVAPKSTQEKPHDPYAHKPYVSFRYHTFAAVCVIIPTQSIPHVCLGSFVRLTQPTSNFDTLYLGVWRTNEGLVEMVLVVLQILENTFKCNPVHRIIYVI